MRRYLTIAAAILIPAAVALAAPPFSMSGGKLILGIGGKLGNVAGSSGGGGGAAGGTPCTMTGATCLTTHIVQNMGSTSTPSATYVPDGSPLGAGMVPAGNHLVVQDASGNAIPYTEGQESTYGDTGANNGSLRMAALYYRLGTLTPAQEFPVKIGYAPGTPTTTTARTDAEVKTHNFHVQIRNLKGTADTLNDGSGSFDCALNTVSGSTMTTMSGPTMRVTQWDQWATDNSGGAAHPHLRCRWLVYQPTGSSGNADGIRITAKVYQGDIDPISGPAEEPLSANVTMVDGGAALSPTYHMGYASDGTTLTLTTSFSILPHSGFWIADANGEPFWTHDHAAMTAINVQHDKFFERSTRMFAPYAYEDISNPTPLVMNDTSYNYAPYVWAVNPCWSQSTSLTATGFHGWLGQHTMWSAAHMWTQDWQKWKTDRACSLNGINMPGLLWWDQNTDHVPDATPVGYFGSGSSRSSSGYFAPGQKTADIKAPLSSCSWQPSGPWTTGGCFQVGNNDFTHDYGSNGYETYLHSGDYMFLDMMYDHMGGGLFGWCGGGCSTRSQVINGHTYPTGLFYSDNVRAIGWYHVALAETAAAAVDAHPEKAYFEAALKTEADGIDDYYTANPNMAAVGVYFARSTGNYAQIQSASYMQNYVDVGMFTADELYGNQIPTVRANAIRVAKHQELTGTRTDISPRFALLSQAIRTWNDETSATNWITDATRQGFRSTGATTRNQVYYITGSNQILYVTLSDDFWWQTPTWSYSYTPNQCDKVIVDPVSAYAYGSASLAPPSGLSTNIVYYMRDIDTSDPHYVKAHLAASCNGGVPSAAIAFNGQTAGVAAGCGKMGTANDSNIYTPNGGAVTTSSALSALPAGVAFTCQNSWVMNTHQFTTNKYLSGNIESEGYGAMHFAKSMGYPMMDAAVARLEFDGGAMDNILNINGGDARFRYGSHF